VATCITLCRWVDRTGEAVRDNLLIAAEYRQMVAVAGGLLVSIYWTRGGAYDVVLTTEWPDEAAAAGAVAGLNALPGLNGTGASQTQTLRVQGIAAMQHALHLTAG
jgi:uncharacterized protein with GYD domain